MVHSRDFFLIFEHFQGSDEKSAVEKRYTQWLRHVNLFPVGHRIKERFGVCNVLYGGA